MIDDARELLAHQLAEDGNLYRSAKELLDHFAKPEAIEGFRFFSVRELSKQRSKLREELDRFARLVAIKWRSGRPSTPPAS